MRRADVRDHDLVAKPDTSPKRPWAPPKVEELPPLTELALGSVEGGGTVRDRVF
jgi:hypothetical protein